MSYFYLRIKVIKPTKKKKKEKKEKCFGFPNQTSWMSLISRVHRKKCQFSVKEKLLLPTDSPFWEAISLYLIFLNFELNL